MHPNRHSAAPLLQAATIEKMHEHHGVLDPHHALPRTTLAPQNTAAFLAPASIASLRW